MAQWRTATLLKQRHRISLTGLLRSLLLGVPLPPPLACRGRPWRGDAETAHMLMLLRTGLVQAVSLVAREQTTGGSENARTEHACTLLEQQLGDLLPLLDALARALLSGADHE